MAKVPDSNYHFVASGAIDGTCLGMVIVSGAVGVFSRKVLSWAMSGRIDQQLVIDAPNSAKFFLRAEKKLPNDRTIKRT